MVNMLDLRVLKRASGATRHVSNPTVLIFMIFILLYFQLRIYPPVINNKADSYAVLIDSCDTLTQRMSSPITNRITVIESLTLRLRTIRTLSTLRKKPKSLILTRWICKLLTKIHTEARKEKLLNPSMK